MTAAENYKWIRTNYTAGDKLRYWRNVKRDLIIKLKLFLGLENLG